MSTKVGSEFTIATGGDALNSTRDNLNGFTRKKVDLATGENIKENSVKEQRDFSAKKLDTNTQGRNVDRSGDNASRPVATPQTPKTTPKTDKEAEKSAQRENFLTAKADAKGLNQLAAGNKQVAQPDAAQKQQEAALRQNVQDNRAPQTSNQAPVQQNTAAMQAGTTAPALKQKGAPEQPQTAKQAPDSPKGQAATAEGVKKAQNAEGAQIQQQLPQTAGQQAAAQQGKVAESKQQNLEGADNKDGEVKREEEEEETPQSAYLAAQRSSKNLDGLLGGMDAGVGGNGGGEDSEQAAAGFTVKAQKAVPDSALIDEKSGVFPLEQKLGTHYIHSEDSEAQASSKLAAKDYKINVEKALSRFTKEPFEKVIENNQYGKGIVDRIVAETKKELEMAGLLLSQLRGRRCEKLVG